MGSVAVVTAKLAANGYDLPPVQYAAMQAIAAHPEIDQVHLAALIAYDRTTIGGVIARLLLKGLVEREVSLTDRRVRVWRLSSLGPDTLKVVHALVLEAQWKYSDPTLTSVPSRHGLYDPAIPAACVPGQALRPLQQRAMSRLWLLA